MHWPESIVLERFSWGISVSFTNLVQCLETLENHGALFCLAECSSTREDMPGEKVLFFKCSNFLHSPSKLSILILCLSFWWLLLLLGIHYSLKPFCFIHCSLSWLHIHCNFSHWRLESNSHSLEYGLDYVTCLNNRMWWKERVGLPMLGHKKTCNFWLCPWEHLESELPGKKPHYSTAPCSGEPTSRWGRW